MKNEKVTIKEDVSFDPYEELANAIVNRLLKILEHKAQRRGCV